jgi:hypothetical protein
MVRRAQTRVRMSPRAGREETEGVTEVAIDAKEGRGERRIE